MKLSSNIAKETCFGGSFEGWTHVDEEQGDDRRWYRTNMVVLRGPDGMTYAFDYEEGLTENQENMYPWGDRYDKNPPEEIDVYRVIPVEITKTEWRVAKS